MSALEKYKDKRNFKKTPEPSPAKKSGKGSLRFVVQKLRASHLHYDFRLENKGVLLSWAVPKGPSLNPDDKRLAMAVEDHPFDYRTFEGVIPEGNYGAGTVMVWDEGTYGAMGPDGKEANRSDSEKIIAQGMHKGHITFFLHGNKLNGEFALVKIKGGKTGKGNSWLLVKADDDSAEKRDVTKEDKSAVTGRSLDEIVANKDKVWKSDRSEKKSKSVDFKGAKKSKLLKEVKPMLARLVKESFDGDDWIFEIKFDGYRAIAEVDNKKVRLYSRNNISFNDIFSPVVESLQKLGRQAVLDGEVVVVDKKGVSKFQLLQNYQKTGKGELAYFVFDILYLDGYDLRTLSLLKRKEILKGLIEDLDDSAIRFSDHIKGDGKQFFKAAQQQGLEGIIAKRCDSEYIGKRSDNWLKVKTHMRQEAVIGGFTAPKGSRKNLGALILGVYEGDKLVYIGHTGGGLNQQGLQDIHNKIKGLAQKESPFNTKFKTNAPVTWVEPKLVCEVSFQEWTDTGHMRQPIFEGLRVDKKPRDVKREQVENFEVVEDVKDNDMKKTKKKTIKDTPKGKDYEVKIDGHLLNLTHLDKIYWPKDKYTKGDLVEYYTSVAEYMLPYLKDRPESLNRHPNGIEGDNFFQKDVDHQGPEWVQRIPVYSESNKKEINYLLCQDKATLIYMANLGCIEINPWSSRTGALDNPDFLVIDLDPEKISFEAVIQTAKEVKKVFDSIGIDSYCKTSGATGLHIFAPLAAKYDYDQVKEFARVIAILVNKKLPKITSIERMPKKRQGKVYLDFLQNRKGQTLAAPYSVRPKEGATVSTPLKWSEVKKGLNPKKFTIKNTVSRIKKTGDLWKPVLGSGADLEKALSKLEKLYFKS
jgi:bifunctional non-homologous end joining protein LigD